MVKYLRIDTGSDFPDINQLPIGTGVFVKLNGATEIDLVNMSNLTSFTKSGDAADISRIPVMRLTGTGFTSATLFKIHEAIEEALTTSWHKSIVDLELVPGEVVSAISVVNEVIPKPATK